MMNGSPLLAAFANATPNNSRPGTEAEDNLDDAHTSDLNEAIVPTVRSSTRLLQHVATKAQRVKVLKWMQETVDSRGSDLHIVSEAVKAFPEVFRAERYQANIMKASRWWQARHSMLADFEKDNLSLSHTYLRLRKRVELKARPGRGRKTADWSAWLYPLVRSEFERLRRVGLKFSPGVLQMVAKSVLINTPHPTYGPSTILADHSKPLLDRITPRWIQQFQDVQGIVHRTQTGKLQVSPAKEEFIHRSVAYHMGQLQRGFASGELHEDLLENMDETHFVVNMDNKKTLGFRGDKEVKYADVVAGGVGITMVVKVTGGRFGKIAMPMLIFQNAASSYPIRGTPDNVPGVTYRTAKKSFMTSGLLTEYYRERRVSCADASGRRKIQFIDNYPGHNIVPKCEEALDRINTEIWKFPANSTHLTQSCDSFVISKIKDVWRRLWEEKNLEMINAGIWQGDGRQGTSGALRNPGWHYFLQVAAQSVREVNAQRDKKHSISFARKAMIRCGLSLSLDGVWTVDQLTPQLKEIIKKFPRNFDGFRDGLPVVEDGSMAVPRSLVVPIENVPVSQDVPSCSTVVEDATVVEDVHAEEGDALSDDDEGTNLQADPETTEFAEGHDSLNVDHGMELVQIDADLWGFLEQYSSH